MTETHDIEAIEQLLYITLVPGDRQVKGALLLATAFDTSDFPADNAINSALDKLVVLSDIQSSGLYHRWRNSEIRRNSADNS